MLASVNDSARKSLTTRTFICALRLVEVSVLDVSERQVGSIDRSRFDTRRKYERNGRTASNKRNRNVIWPAAVKNYGWLDWLRSITEICSQLLLDVASDAIPIVSNDRCDLVLWTFYYLFVHCIEAQTITARRNVREIFSAKMFELKYLS